MRSMASFWLGAITGLMATLSFTSAAAIAFARPSAQTAVQQQEMERVDG
tara:strand:+ start:2975 stop:3121 length:147 start_codon:yes stop_codon:yes gene_type:complete